MGKLRDTGSWGKGDAVLSRAVQSACLYRIWMWPRQVLYVCFITGLEWGLLHLTVRSCLSTQPLFFHSGKHKGSVHETLRDCLGKQIITENQICHVFMLLWNPGPWACPKSYQIAFLSIRSHGGFPQLQAVKALEKTKSTVQFQMGICQWVHLPPVPDVPLGKSGLMERKTIMTSFKNSSHTWMALLKPRLLISCLLTLLPHTSPSSSGWY